MNSAFSYGFNPAFQAANSPFGFKSFNQQSDQFSEVNPLKGLQLEREQFAFGQERQMFPYQLLKARLGVKQDQSDLSASRGMNPYQIKQAATGLQASELGLRRGEFEFGQAQKRSPFEMRSLEAGTRAAELGVKRGEFEFGEEQSLSPFRLRSTQAGAEAAELGARRSRYELEDFEAGAAQRAAERQYAEARAKSSLSFLPQMEAMRGGIANRIISMTGTSPSFSGAPYQGGGGFSWMQNYKPPQFPR